jgi:hypothetical protein
MKTARVFFFFFLLIFQKSAFAQQGMNPEMCERLFDVGLAKYDVASDTTRFSVFHDNLCTSHMDTYQSFSNSSGSLGISIPVAKQILGLTGSEEQNNSNYHQIWDQMCHQQAKQDYFRERFKSSSSTVSTELNTSFTTCMNTYRETFLGTHKVLVTADPYPNLEGFTATIYLNSQGLLGHEPKINSIAPDGLNCTYHGAPVVLGTTALTQAQSILNCQKPADDQVTLRVEVEALPVSNSVTVPGYKLTLADMNQRLTDMQAELATFQNKLDSVGKVNQIMDSDGGCEILGDRQTCWGSKDFSGLSGKGEVPGGVTLQFKKSFRQGTTPSVTVTLANTFKPNTGQGIDAVGYWTYGTTGFSADNTSIGFGTFHNFLENNPGGSMKVEYIAIGYPEASK